MHLVFVFGTLKLGFPFHTKLRAARFRGRARTFEAFPMFVAGSVFGPMMLDRPGRGQRVLGELYEVTPEELRAVDEAENVGVPGNFRRPVEILTADRRRLFALAYFKHPRLAQPRHSGYLADYQDTRFRLPRERPLSLPPMRLLTKSRGAT